MIVDEMGKASARAQDLKMPITTAEKLSKSDHIIYLMSEQINEEYVFYSYSIYSIYLGSYTAILLYNIIYIYIVYI